MSDVAHFDPELRPDFPPFDAPTTFSHSHILFFFFPSSVRIATIACAIVTRANTHISPGTTLARIETLFFLSHARNTAFGHNTAFARNVPFARNAAFAHNTAFARNVPFARNAGFARNRGKSYFLSLAPFEKRRDGN